ncbi:hypothetical protein SKAU_G00415000 [Synaphobranchus kaupii]|uniref:Uncharacterized protein n=1 Tax=Synaphobranchus kaupii TaxID=118154 RepID=A0A9Q1E767_SYNKA|nr:hypothetical protein SKAU_G00415000 [Synaphobranchus kaupii]
MSKILFTRSNTLASGKQKKSGGLPDEHWPLEAAQQRREERTDRQQQLDPGVCLGLSQGLGEPVQCLKRIRQSKLLWDWREGSASTPLAAQWDIRTGSGGSWQGHPGPFLGNHPRHRELGIGAEQRGSIGSSGLQK